MIDPYLTRIERLEELGYVVLLKWDGERARRKRTVAIGKPNTDLHFRSDGDDVTDLLTAALEWAEAQELHQSATPGPPD